jgi:hypothetical protein
MQNNQQRVGLRTVFAHACRVPLLGSLQSRRPQSHLPRRGSRPRPRQRTAKICPQTPAPGPTAAAPVARLTALSAIKGSMHVCTIQRMGLLVQVDGSHFGKNSCGRKGQCTDARGR